MLLDKLFQPFVEKRPICVMARGLLENLLAAERIDALFERAAQSQYTRELTFSAVVALMSDVILKVQPSVHAAYQTGDYGIGVSLQALYNKLNCVEPGISEELVRDAARQSAPMIDLLQARHKPWLPGYRCRVLDGNHLSATEHRLEVLRTTWSAPLPGKGLVVLDQERMLATDVFLSEDGHAQERSLLDEVIETIRQRDVWIADRNFCTVKFLTAIAQRAAFFLIRQHGTLKGRLVGERRQIGRTETGLVHEQTLLITDSETGEALSVRRITIELKSPTRDGDRELHLLTNVPRDDASARVLSDLYRKRWTIETAFQEITETLACEIDTLAYPKAALFTFCLALLAYNAVAVLKAALRSVHGEKKVVDQVSSYYLSLEIRQTYDGMLVAIPAVHWQIFQTRSTEQMATWLREMAGNVRLSRYRKHPRGPTKKAPAKDQYKNGGHVSTAKLLGKRTH